MKIGIALAELFKDIEINGIKVLTHFGNQKELNAWVTDKMLSSSQKFPLIWYVIAPVEPQGNGKLRVETQLILFQGSEANELNTTRYRKAYLNYLEPLYNEVNKVLQRSSNISLFDAYNGIKYIDEPNFGVEKQSLDFVNNQSVKQKGVTIAIVDAKILNLKMDINPNCIIKK